MAVVLVTLTLIATSVLLYMAFGWRQMDQACTSEWAVPPEATGKSVDFAWSWSPLGFACTWPGPGQDGVTVTKLWW